MKWGYIPKTLRCIYFVVVSLMFIYAAAIWTDKSTKLCIIVKELYKLHKRNIQNVQGYQCCGELHKLTLFLGGIPNYEGIAGQ